MSPNRGTFCEGPQEARLPPGGRKLNDTTKLPRLAALPAIFTELVEIQLSQLAVVFRAADEVTSYREGVERRIRAVDPLSTQILAAHLTLERSLEEVLDAIGIDKATRKDLRLNTFGPKARLTRALTAGVWLMPPELDWGSISVFNNLRNSISHPDNELETASLLRDLRSRFPEIIKPEIDDSEAVVAAAAHMCWWMFSLRAASLVEKEWLKSMPRLVEAMAAAGAGMDRDEAFAVVAQTLRERLERGGGSVEILARQAKREENGQ